MVKKQKQHKAQDSTKTFYKAFERFYSLIEGHSVPLPDGTRKIVAGMSWVDIGDAAKELLKQANVWYDENVEKEHKTETSDGVEDEWFEISATDHNKPIDDIYYQITQIFDTYAKPGERFKDYWNRQINLSFQFFPGMIFSAERWAILQSVRDKLSAKYKRDREPLGEVAGLIYEKLLTLPEHKAMILGDIVTWLNDTHRINLSDNKVQEHLDALKPWGLKNKKRIGYYIVREQS